MYTSLNLRILLLALNVLFATNAKAQSLCWAQAINGIGALYGTGVSTGTTDSAGNIYSVGGFGGTVDFDRSAGVHNLTAVSNGDMFIIKEDPSGNLVWVKQVKGLSNGVYGCGGSRIDVDRNRNLFITGYFRDSFDFDPGPAAYKLYSYGGYHAFILKLDSSGNFVWVKDIGTQVSAVGLQALAARQDRNGYLYFAALVTGNGTTPVDVDPGPATYNVIPNIGDILLEKLDSNGNFIWAKLITGDNAKQTWSLAFDSSSNVLISGNLWGSADFDPGPGVYTLTATPTTPPLTSGSDFFVAKYDSAGSFVWAKSIGGGADDPGLGGTVDRFGNVFVTGSFGGTVDFDPGPGVYNLTAASTRSIFTLKLRNNGDFAWARMIGASVGLFEGRAIATDDTGNVYTTAIAPGGCDVDPGPAVHIVSGGCIVQKLDSAGNFVWGASWEAQAPGWIGLDNKDSIYITGIFSGANKDFDPGPGTFLLSGVGGSTFSGFILKLNQIPQPDTSTGINSEAQQTEVSVYPNPSTGRLTFLSPFSIHHIQLTDMTGKVVYINEPAKSKAVIELSCKAGVYFYEVDCGAAKQRGKLVIY